ncbi:hypothetical protein QA601_18325 [Chitinispirillales bacterium ANBcel5]|uniref:hypothetical protein n=1 Tax=Cellulosispirillum alkaliphilum TaxID=3039283 RepID=UPI002A53FD08|nr:hypothetical protein [Chitinispirillales bacterium ANBcel5]
MIKEKKRPYSIIGYSVFTIIPLLSVALWVFGGVAFLPYYLVTGLIASTIAFFFLQLKQNRLFWHFLAPCLTYFFTMGSGLAMITGALLALALGNTASADIIMALTLLFFICYSFFPLKYYYDDYHFTEKDRLKCFDFRNGTYFMSQQTIIDNKGLVRSGAFADYYSKSFLSKAHHGVIGLNILFPIGGGAIAIIAGRISKNFQLGIGVFAAFLSTVMFIQFGIAGVFNAWQVRQLEKKHGKKIHIIWGDEKE